jgi:hypothetical protein
MRQSADSGRWRINGVMIASILNQMELENKWNAPISPPDLNIFYFRFFFEDSIKIMQYRVILSQHVNCKAFLNEKGPR